MGKTIDELKLDDTPIEEPKTDDRDIHETEWYRFILEINDLLDDEGYGWAEATLTGIAETVERTKRVSEAQRRAVANIVAGRSRRRWPRRYDGLW